MIPVHVNLGGYPSRPLPPQLVQFGTDEVVLVELQGSLEVEGNLNGQYVGKLTVDGEKVSSCLFAVASVWCQPPAEKVNPPHWTPPTRGEARQPPQTTCCDAPSFKFIRPPRRRSDGLWRRWTRAREATTSVGYRCGRETKDGLREEADAYGRSGQTSGR